MQESRVGKTNCGIVGERDAFHVPVVLVTSDSVVKGKDNARFVDDSYTKVMRSDDTLCPRHGVVDIYIDIVKPGTAFWVMLLPDSVKKLNHTFEISLSDVPSAINKHADLEFDDDYDDSYNECRGCY